MTAEELLMMSDDIETYSADDALVIDAENRIILTPAGGLLLGVESDEEAERIKFVCPRIVGDNIDLSTLQLRAIYRNANGDKDFRICTDITIDGENIRFSWSLSRKVTRYKGTVNFIICAIRTQSDGSIKNEWNTTLAEGKVLEGLEVDISEEEFEEPKDIVLQLLGMLDDKEAELLEEVENLRTDVKADIETTKQKAMDDVEAKGVETLKTIPEDYTYIANLAKENKQLKANAIKRTYSGETIVATDSSGIHLEGLRVLGRSEQESTTGAQLCEKNIKGYINQTNTHVAIDGNAEMFVFYAAKDTTYTFGSDVIGDRNLICYADSIPDNNNVQVYDISSLGAIKSKYTFTSKYNAYVGIYINSSRNDEIAKTFMVNVGETLLPYEPYTGGKPSPSVNYPQPIESIGDDGSIDVGVYGGNSVNFTQNGSTNYETFEVLDDGYTIIVSGTRPYFGAAYDMLHLKGRTVYIRYDKKEKSNPNGDYIVQFHQVIDGKNSYSSYQDGQSSIIEIDKKATSASLKIIGNNNSMSLDSINILKIYGLRITVLPDMPWEPYKESQSLPISTPNGLPAIKVTDSSLATYTDANGVMWCADEVVCGEKKIQRVYTEVFDGSDDETITYHTNSDFATGGYLRIGLTRNSVYYKTGIPELLSSHFITNENVDSIMKDGNCTISSTGKHITIVSSVFTSVETARAWLQANPITVLYRLDTPIETELSASEIAAYKALISNYPTTTILNDENAHMEVTLVADTKNHIEQNYVPKSEFLSVVDRVSALEQKALA